MTGIHHRAIIAGLLASLSIHAAHAQSYSADDVHLAITAAAHEHNVSHGLLDCMVRRESTWNPYAIGAQGEMGAVQLSPQGLYRDFLARGYVDPFNPYEAVDYLAQALNRGLGPQWTTWRLCRGS